MCLWNDDNRGSSRPYVHSQYGELHMGQGQASGTAAALCAAKNCRTRELKYKVLRKTLEKDGVYFES